METWRSTDREENRWTIFMGQTRMNESIKRIGTERQCEGERVERSKSGQMRKKKNVHDGAKASNPRVWRHRPCGIECQRITRRRGAKLLWDSHE